MTNVEAQGTSVVLTPFAERRDAPVAIIGRSPQRLADYLEENFSADNLTEN
jgi:hypothetical protein